MSEGPDNFASIRFSTGILPKQDRVAMWREQFGRQMLRVEIEPDQNQRFRVEATMRALPGLRMARFAGSTMRLIRGRGMVSDGDDSIGLIINLAGKATVTQRGREVVLGRGAACAVLHNEPAVLTGAHHVGLLVPRGVLARRARNLEDATARLIASEAEPLRLLVNYLNHLLRNELAFEPPGLRHAAVDHIQVLTALALEPRSEVAEGGLSAISAARLNSALDYINANFGNPGLSLTAVARSQNVSARYLRRLFESTGSSFASHVNERRLQRAFALLSAPQVDGRRISEIALHVGFSDISHFNHLFRSRFSETPSEVRGERGRAKATSRDAGRDRATRPGWRLIPD